MPDYNIANRFGPLHRSANNPARYPDFPFFYRAFAAQFFGVDDGYPKTASLRASRSHEGCTRIVPLSFLDAVVLPGDYPRLSDDPLVTDEAELQAHYESHFPLSDLDVRLPAVGSPIVSTAASRFAREDLCRLAAARAIGFDEIAVRILYV